MDSILSGGLGLRLETTLPRRGSHPPASWGGNGLPFSHFHCADVDINLGCLRGMAFIADNAAEPAIAPGSSSDVLVGDTRKPTLNQHFFLRGYGHVARVIAPITHGYPACKGNQP